MQGSGRGARAPAKALKAPRLQVLKPPGGPGRGMRSGIKIPDAPSGGTGGGELLVASGLGLRLGVGGSGGLKFRRGADTSVLAAMIVRIRVWDARKDAHPAPCRASWKDGGTHKLERLPLDFKLVRESDAVVNPATEGPTGSPWEVMSPFKVQGQPFQVKKCQIHMNAFMKS